MAIIPLNSVVFTLFLILSLIAGTAAQSSAQAATNTSPSASQASVQASSQASQAASQTSLVTSQTSQATSQSSQVASQTSQAISQAASPSITPTSSQAASAAPIVVPNVDADKNFVIGDTCDVDQKSIIKTAFVGTGTLAFYGMLDWSNANLGQDPPFVENLGTSAIQNASTVESVFKDYSSATVSAAWKINAVCDIKNETAACQSKHVYGGIGSEGPRVDLKPNLYFCWEYFRFPPLNEAVQMGLSDSVDWTRRFNMGSYHENQASALLRALLYYLPQREGWNRHISNLKLLAQLADSETWSILNADNYALFALQKYVSHQLGESNSLGTSNFPWLPRLEDGPNPIIKPFVSGDIETFQVTPEFSAESDSQWYYDVERYQKTDILDFKDQLPKESQADLENAPWSFGATTSGFKALRDKFLKVFNEAKQHGMSNLGASKEYTCYREDKTAFPDAIAFTFDEVQSELDNFCKNKVNDYMLAGKPLHPRIFQIDKEVELYTQLPDGTKDLSYYVAPGPDSFMTGKNLSVYFEGIQSDEKASHCIATYNDLITHCDGADSDDKYGGYLKIYDMCPAILQLFISYRSSYSMFNAIKKVRSLATSVFRPNGLTLTIFLILSLIADGAAQSSSQVASAVSQTASVTSQVVSAASQASQQASSQADSQSPSQTLAQTGPQPAVSALPSTAGSIISIDDSCKAEHRDMLDNDLKDVMDMANVTAKSQTAYTDNPNFWLFFGKSSVEHIPVIKSAFPGVLQLSEPISVTCNFDGSAPCADRTNFPGIAKTQADNYALFALSNYVSQAIGGTVPYFPRIDDDPSYGKMVVPFNDEESAQIQVKGWFHWRGLSQPNYDPSLLQPDKAEFDIGTELDEERKADILSAPYYRELPDESIRGKEDSWIGTFVDAHKDQLLNTDATSDRTCFGESHAQYPNAKEFDGEEAVGFSQQFCEDIIKSWDPRTPIPPSVRDTADFRNASRAYKLTKTNADSHVGFFACDTDPTKRRGGVLKLNDRLYGVYVTPDEREDKLPWLTDYTALGDLKCANYNDTSNWHIKTSIEGTSKTESPVDITDREKLGDICSCWYSAFPFTFDLFCKGSASKCEDLAKDDKRKAALWDDFACSL
ncbi:hypothetical protein J4E93_010913 [Alternaria ventricosa]|uniref:uncharacterized protein n=1 Tax=Alternaria ventricosa TaxID=1187951 RepID=UPI0020C26BF4|nr:uncharacterized protein J4E93_010913 [Alternaria ventricosa]KAI4636788.1 hypothetical protein J4E93_010913 [Alternaria ventricosa]